MNKQEYLNGIEKYIEFEKKKPYSEETKELHTKYITPILEISSKKYLKENPLAAWSGSFFQKDKILSRVGIRENSIYKEKEKYFSLDEIISLIEKGY